jgi:uncharacterized protein (TIGR02117 family)
MKLRLGHLARLLLLPVIAAALYFGVAFMLLLFPANSHNSQQNTDGKMVDVFVISNGVHADLVFPVKSIAIDWRTTFPLKDFAAPPPDPTYIAIGWGDREFYLNTQTLSDLTAGRALGALAGGHRSLVHVNYLPDLAFGKRLYKLPLSATQYSSLIAYVRSSLLVSPDGQSLVIAGRRYGPLDAFYEARGSYSLFNTCNTWIGRGLAQAGVKVSHWTPLDSMVLWYLQPAQNMPAT